MNNEATDQKQSIPVYESLPHKALHHIYFHTAYHFCMTMGFFLLRVKHTQKRKKLHKINKWKKTKKKTNGELTHLHGNIYKNIKLDYSSANSIYYCT